MYWLFGFETSGWLPAFFKENVGVWIGIAQSTNAAIATGTETTYHSIRDSIREPEGRALYTERHCQMQSPATVIFAELRLPGLQLCKQIKTQQGRTNVTGAGLLDCWTPPSGNVQRFVRLHKAGRQNTKTDEDGEQHQ